MGDVQKQLQELENRRQALQVAEARAAANAERAQQDLTEATQALSAMGFSTVEEAEEWLRKSAVEVSEKISALDALLTKAGV